MICLETERGKPPQALVSNALDVLFTEMTNQGKMTKEARKARLGNLIKTDGQYENSRPGRIECGVAPDEVMVSRM